MPIIKGVFLIRFLVCGATNNNHNNHNFFTIFSMDLNCLVTIPNNNHKQKKNNKT